MWISALLIFFLDEACAVIASNLRVNDSFLSIWWKSSLSQWNTRVKRISMRPHVKDLARKDMGMGIKCFVLTGMGSFPVLRLRLQGFLSRLNLVHVRFCHASSLSSYVALKAYSTLLFSKDYFYQKSLYESLLGKDFGTSHRTIFKTY